VASHWIGKTKLQRYDTVIYKGMKCFIYGSTNGRLVLKDIYGNAVTENKSVNSKAVKYIARKRNNLLISHVNIREYCR